MLSRQLFYDDDEYGLAEMASGFNRETLISPLHGAMIASVFANDGVSLFFIVSGIPEGQLIQSKQLLLHQKLG